jgi:hypothetical protein
MTRFLNAIVYTGFIVACFAFVIDDFALATVGIVAAGVATLVDYVRN